MSEENVEKVRWAYEESMAKRTVDVPGADERVAPGYRFHARHGFPGRLLYTLDEMPALWADLDATFSDHSLVPENYEAIGSDYVLVTVKQAATLRGSDQRIDQTIYHLWRIVDGMLDETWTFTDEDAARKAAEAGRASS